MLKYVCMICEKTTYTPQIDVERGYLVCHVKIHCDHCDGFDYHPVISKENRKEKPKKVHDQDEEARIRERLKRKRRL